MCGICEIKSGEKPLTKESVVELFTSLRDDLDTALEAFEEKKTLVDALEFGEELAGEVVFALLQAGPAMGGAARAERLRIVRNN